MPPGATEVDVGPILEPILARIVRLERMAGYNDLVTSDDRYRWSRSRDKIEDPGNRPVLTPDIKAWLMWAVVDRETTERLRFFTYEAVTQLLKKDGWSPSSSYSHCYDNMENRGEEWRFDQEGDIFGHSGRKTIHERVLVPRSSMHDDKRVYHFWHILAAVKTVRYKKNYTEVSIPQLMSEVESLLHPLVQLAMQAPP